MAKVEQFAAERKLLETLERIGRSRTNYSLLYVSVSKLKPKHRHASFVKIISRLFDDLVGAANGGLFVMTNGDFAILGQNITSKTVENAVDVLRSCLGADPILLAQNTKDFAKVYEFPDDLVEFYSFLDKMMNEEQANSAQSYTYAIDASQIDVVVEHLNNINIPELIKHQSVIRLESANKYKTLFQEFFVAVKDLSRLYDKNLDLVANKWLFLYLTQTLDKKTLSSFLFADVKNWPKHIGLNLNLSSVFSNEFVNFTQNFLTDEQKIVAEVQMMDVLNSLNLYLEAKDILHQGGHKILIDAMSIDMLKMLDVFRLQPDMIKLFWDPMMAFDDEDADFRSFVEKFGADNIILAKCIDAKAVKWGVKYGIRNFQGPYMDAMEVALIKAECPAGEQCKAEDCLKRRRLLAGKIRLECPQKDYLEKMLG